MYKDLKIFENRIINSDKATIKGTNIILKETGTGKVLLDYYIDIKHFLPYPQLFQ